MIDYLAPKFRSMSIARTAVHEPRAAFLLNRFSETLPILYATHAALFVLSCNPEEAVGRSFYEYIDEQYLLGAVNAIERAKENNSIAYLRLLWKLSIEPLDEHDDPTDCYYDEDQDQVDEDEDQIQRPGLRPPRQRDLTRPPDCREVECIVSCSSDGLIVVVRQAPPIDGLAPHLRPPGVFAAPWAASPIAPNTMTPPPPSPVSAVASSPGDDALSPGSISLMVPRPRPSDADVMNSIQEVSVFVWSISTLNDQVSRGNVSNVVSGLEMYSEEEVPEFVESSSDSDEIL
jgi:hypothetical protein